MKKAFLLFLILFMFFLLISCNGWRTDQHPQDTTLPANSEASTQTAIFGTDPSGVITDPPFWRGMVYTPYAIVELTEITSETARMMQGGEVADYLKVKCKIAYAYHMDILAEYLAPYVSEERYNDLSDMDLVEEIYVTKKTVAHLDAVDTIFVQMDFLCDAEREGEYYFAPILDDEGYSEFLVIRDGALMMNEDDLRTNTFHTIYLLNQELELAAREKINGRKNTVANAFPKKPLVNGATTDEIVVFLSAWDDAARALDDARLFR